MDPNRRAFLITALPDPRYARYQAHAGGDVTSAISRGCERLLRAVAGFPAETVTAEIRFVYVPCSKQAECQRRLRIYLGLWASDEAIAERVSTFISRGPLCAYYKFEPTCETPRLADGMQAGCDVFRRAYLEDALHPPELNCNSPTCYLRLESFMPNKDNEPLVDEVLGNLSEPVEICVRVEPANIVRERSEHMRYLEHLYLVNRSYDREQELPGADYLGTDSGPAYGVQHSLDPLRQRDPTADDVLRAQQSFRGTLSRPHLLFHIRILAPSSPTSLLVGQAVAESAFTEGSYELVTYRRGEELFDQAVRSWTTPRVVTLPIWKSLSGEGGNHLYSHLARLVSLAPVEELVGAFRLPVAAQGSPSCIRKNTDPPTETELIVFGHDVEPSSGASGCDDGGVPRGVRLDQLVKHLFVSGLPGSGKTTSVMNLLIQMANIPWSVGAAVAGEGATSRVKQTGVPVMVIESAKTEYCSLKRLKHSASKSARRLGETLEVYTPGLESVSPVRLNPLEPPPGTPIEEHIEILIGCFQASMPMSGPLPALLREALERVYEKHPDPQLPPVISDLLAAAEAVLAEKHYSAETNSDIRAALEVRLGILTHGLLGRIFQCRRSIPSIDHLTHTFSVHELDHLPRETACLYTLILLTWIRQYLKSLEPARNTRLVIVIEEAHNLVGRSTEAVASEEAPDPRAFAADFVCRLLAELRALGVGVVIVDQLPSGVASQVIKNTASKLAFRQVATDDRAELGGTMLFGKTEMEECARLCPGEAFFSTEGYYGPRRIQAENLHAQLDLTPPRDGELRAWMSEEPWFGAVVEAHCVTELTQLREHMDTLDIVLARVATQITRLRAACQRFRTEGAPRERRSCLASVRSRAQALRTELLTAERSFVRGPFRMLLPSETVIKACPNLEDLRASLVKRFSNAIEPGTRARLKLLDRLIALCGALARKEA